MELILLQDVEKIGRKGDVIRVRDGYARNFLLPRQLALPSTRANQEFFEEQRVRMVKRREKEKAAAQALSEKVSQVKLSISSPAGEQDKLFGSVTADDIAEALKAKGFSFDRKQIVIKEPIRTLGAHTVTVEVFPQVKAPVTVEVVRKA